MRLVSVREMKRLEESANSAGYGYMEMMHRAGVGIADLVDLEFRRQGGNLVIGLVGGGNNGGDTLIAISELARRGWASYVVLFTPRIDGDPLLAEFKEQNGKTLLIDQLKVFDQGVYEAKVILDGVFGTGFHSSLPENIREDFQQLAESCGDCTTVAVDCPSGVDCETGAVSKGTRSAEMTICLEAVKKGLLAFPAFDYCGQIRVVDLGLSRYAQDEDLGNISVVDAEFVRGVIPERSNDSHKGCFGKVLIAGGSANYSGAPVLAGNAAYAVGAGLVQVAVPEIVYHVAAGSNLELTWLLLDSYDGVISDAAVDTFLDSAASADCVVIGPGMGQQETTRRFLQKMIVGSRGDTRRLRSAGFYGLNEGMSKSSEIKMPSVVVDADALTLFSKEYNWFDQISSQAVLTPHPGEMAILTGLSVADIQANRMDIASKFARKWKKVVVLKGALTVIADESGKTAVVPVATSALAKAGTGDVLAGMIGGLIAQGCELFDAAAAATWIHGQAGLCARDQVGSAASVLASDVIDVIPKVLKTLHK